MASMIPLSLLFSSLYNGFVASASVLRVHETVLMDYDRPLYGNITYCASGNSAACQTLSLHEACEAQWPFLDSLTNGVLRLMCSQETDNTCQQSERSSKHRRWTGPGWVTETFTFSCPTAPITVYPTTCAPGSAALPTTAAPGTTVEGVITTTTTTTITTDVTMTTNTTQGWVHSVVSSIFSHNPTTTTTTSNTTTTPVVETITSNVPINPLTAPIPQLTSSILQLTTPVAELTSAVPTVNAPLTLTTPTELAQPTTVLPSSAAPPLLAHACLLEFIVRLLILGLTFAFLQPM